MNKCRSCGRMLKADEQGKDFCKNCVDENGKLRSYEEVAENLAGYLRETQGLSEKTSENAAKAIVSSQPVWEKKQGVYFEGDMKRKRNAIVTLIVIISLILVSIGIGSWVYFGDKPKEQFLFLDVKHERIEREVNGINISELDIPHYQGDPKQIFSDDPSVISFTSARYNTKDEWIIGDHLYTYDIKNDVGTLATPDQYKYCLSSKIQSVGNYEKKGNIYLAEIQTPEALGSHYSEEKSLFMMAFWMDKGTFADDYEEKYSRTRFPETYSYYQFEEFVSDTDHNVLWVETRKDAPIFYGPYFVGDYFAWVEGSSQHSGPDQIVIYNRYTEKEETITRDIYDNRYLFCDAGIVWMDNGDISKSYPVISFYDVKDHKKHTISNEKDIGFYISNNRYLLISKGTRKDEHNRPKDELLVYDLIEKRFLNDKITEDGIECAISFKKTKWTITGWEWEAKLNISEGNTLDESVVAWVEEIDDINDLPWKNPEPFNDNEKKPRIIRLKRLSDLDKNAYKVSGTNDKSESQIPLKVTKDYICWSSMDRETLVRKLWIGKIEDGNDDGIIESICIDINDREDDFTFQGVSISDQNIYWSTERPNHRANICWAKLSEIFPE